MFIQADGQNEIHKFAPENNLVVIDDLSSLPILTCDVSCQISPRSPAKMFLQGLVACRQWRYILPEALKDKNMFLGLLVGEKFDVDLYLFSADSNYDVRLVKPCVLIFLVDYFSGQGGP